VVNGEIIPREALFASRTLAAAIFCCVPYNPALGFAEAALRIFF